MSTNVIHLQDRIQPVEGHLVSDMNGEKVMMSIQSGKYYNLGGMGSIIWERLSAGQTVGQLIEQLESQYEVRREDCESQVLTFLQQLHQEGLIRLQSSS
ncbi:lasso peptide biosynthesis PqqD family chaperone [Paenibacillus sp. SYP-B4298]|uniref:lasso peptide biosynthesis PqqD family chaperone n=1 Tax=Paenibacillus sp. SYP-B4298 TaxID=2996034 RepID=UPI0022DE76A1|nr:lasso peptide biosynthesis PqqD family chaperone [Paenibacillus sp. SYP-B4298]